MSLIGKTPPVNNWRRLFRIAFNANMNLMSSAYGRFQPQSPDPDFAAPISLCHLLFRHPGERRYRMHTSFATQFTPKLIVSS
jgi:hypothetical protein